MHRLFVTLSSVVLSLAASSAGASAACTMQNLADTWDAYAYGDADGEAFWERCVIRVDANGNILPSSSCRTDTDERSALSGNFAVSTSCRLTGTLVQQFSGEPRNSCSIVQATMSKDKLTVIGVGKCRGTDSIFSYSMTRY